MSCLPGMPCYDVIIKTLYNSDCDPCANVVVDAERVEYSGPNLSCIGVETCDTLEVALQKIDDKICSSAFIVQILTAILASPSLTTLFGSVMNAYYSTTTTTTTIP